MTQEQINSLLAKPATKSCTWIEDADGNWHTGCNEIHIIIDGTPSENGYVYCQYCGSKIETVLYNAPAHGREAYPAAGCSAITEVGSAILRYQAEANRKACEAGAHERALHEFTTGIFSEDARKREWVFVPWSESPRDYAPLHALKWERRLHVVACNTTTSNSQFFNGFYDPEKYEVMCAYSQRSDGKWKVSLYSDKSTIDCGEIAKSFGGGGHKGAAWFVCDNLPWGKL